MTGRQPGLKRSAPTALARARTLARLDTSPASQGQVVDAVPNMIWTARPGGAIDYFNARALEYCGLGVAELRGWRWKRLVYREDWASCFERWTRALASGERFEVDSRLRRADGMYRWHLGIALAQRDASGQIRRWVGSWTDIDAHKGAAALLARAAVAPEVMDRSQDGPDNPLEILSARELQVLQRVVEGRTSAEIAEQLNLSPKSVDTYRSRLMAKLGIEDLPALVKFAIRHGVTTAQ